MCYDSHWDKHTLESLRKSDIPRDQATREAASALVSKAGKFRLLYPKVDQETAAEGNLSGVLTLAYTNLLLL